MLKKLLKYEIKATARIMLPLYLALMIFSLVNMLINPFELLDSPENSVIQTVIGALNALLYFALIIGIIVMTLVIMIQRYYKSLLGDEGYLMFTLPVKSWQHVLSKLLVSLLWTIASFLTTVVSVFIISKVPDPGKVIADIYNMIKHHLGNSALVLIPLYFLAAALSGIMMVYTAITLGHLFQKRKLLASFGMYALLYMIYQAILTVCLLLVGTIFLPSLFESGGKAPPTPDELAFLLAFFSTVVLMLSAASFAVTNYVLKNKLNLE